MRAPDILLSSNYLYDITSARLKENTLSTQIATGKKISKPSDSPSGTSKILTYNSALSQADSYVSNIQNGVTFLDETTSSMESIQSDISNILVNFTQIENATQTSEYSNIADSIELSLNSILDSANSQYDGKYIFGGTDQSGKPYGYTSDNSAIEVKVGDVSGEQRVKVSSNTTQKINMSGTEIFGTVLSLNGNLDINSAVGSTNNVSSPVYDASGNQYTLNATFTKTAGDTYNLSYDILDSGGSTIFSTPPADKVITFDPSSGAIKTIDGTNKNYIQIKDSSHNIDFNFDLSSVKEKDATTSLSISANQKTDIFNTLISVCNNLRAGIPPTGEQQQLVNDFNSKLLNKLADAGNIINGLNNTNDLIQNQKTNVQSSLSAVQDVDVAQAVMELQNQDNTLQMAYKMASMFLPKSLLDYL